MSDLSLKAKIGQMIVVRTSGHLFDAQIRYPRWEATSEQLQYWLSELNIGGVILLGGSAAELALRSRQLQSWAQTPLLIAADIEEGVGQRFEGATWFPPPMALADISPLLAQNYARSMGEIIAQEALALGINWLFAPVVDVNNNADNPVINVRSFGETPATVSQLATAFLEGCQTSPVLTTAKHFPGHGDTAVDSHVHLPVIPHSQERLAEVELPPFAAAIAQGVDSIMTAHLQIPAWDADYPATLSPAILTGQLREKMGFEGLIVTDALIMAGVANFADAQEICVQAVQAGADVLLMPDDPELAIEAVYQAVQSGRISEQRIQESVERVQQVKAKVAPSWQFDEPLVDLGQLATPMATATSEAILKHSLQQGGALPLAIPQGEETPLNLVVVQDALNSPFLGAHTPAIAVPRQFGYECQVIEQQHLARFDVEVSTHP
ncbi:MAG: beta-glucosidase, partial [Kamptonema sp. SIO4C4]|nr:beta-glucosidase [Kamptonema sp. SIO4C4]